MGIGLLQNEQNLKFLYQIQNLTVFTKILAWLAIVKGEGASFGKGVGLDFFKRGIVSFLFMTLSLWLISWAMIENGSANPWNPAWHFVRGLKDFFSSMAAVGFGLAIVIFIAAHLPSIEFSNRAEAKPLVRSPEEIKQEREAAILHREQMAAVAAENKRIEIERQNREYEESQKQEELRKKTRTAEAANREAMREF